MKITKQKMERMIDKLNIIYNAHGLTKKEKDFIWQSMATFCLYQIERKQGVFYALFKESAKK